MRAWAIAAYLACWSAVCSGGQADAQQIAAANFAKLRQTPHYREAVIAGAYKSGTWLVEPCKGAEPGLSDRLAVVAGPVVVDDRLEPQSGGWIEHVAVAGCPASRQLNVLVIVQQPGRVAMVPMLPGTTHADPLLQKDGAAYAFAAAGVDMKGCKPIFLYDTTYVGPLGEPPLVPGKPGWSERWTVGQCDRRADVEMRFVPDAKGTTIVARKAARP